jgi:predicted small secreted protein
MGKLSKQTLDEIVQLARKSGLNKFHIESPVGSWIKAELDHAPAAYEKFFEESYRLGVMSIYNDMMEMQKFIEDAFTAHPNLDLEVAAVRKPKDDTKRD